MSHEADFDIDSYRDEHESDEHWDLRRKFMERWKTHYPQDRLVCLARVFVNMELLGCKYPEPVMKEVSGLSFDIAKEYRNSRKDKLKRTFVSASDAAEDRAKGIKREAGVVIDEPPKKSARVEFVKPGQSSEDANNKIESDNYTEMVGSYRTELPSSVKGAEEKSSEPRDCNDYLKEMTEMQTLHISNFHEHMFVTKFGRLVLLIRPWTSRLGNIQSSAQVCNVALTNSYEKGVFSLMLNGTVVASATGNTKVEAKRLVEMLAWNRLREEVVSVLVKEQWIAHNDSRISFNDMSGNKREEFGSPVESSVAEKMMKMMGWKGGALGSESQGIAEPIKPHLQMVNRAGLGSQTSDIRQLKRAAQTLMQRYIASDALDVDLVFSSEFSKEERAALHQLAKTQGLASRSYGDKDRFLVVKKKLDPFSLVRAVVEKGGSTPKYQVFIPAIFKSAYNFYNEINN